MKKTLLFTLHSVAGLLSGCFILLLSVSGSILVFHDELDAIQQPAVGYGNENKISVDSCYNIMRLHYPRARISNCILPANAASCYMFTLNDPSFKNGKEGMQVFLHPQSGVILKIRGSSDIKDNFMGWLTVFHNSFQLGKTGEWLLGFFSVVFIISLVTGIVLYRENLRAVLLFRRSAYKKNNLHQLIGVYALMFNLLMAFTGLWMQRYVFKKEFYSANTYKKELNASPDLFSSIDSSQKRVQMQFPEFTGHVIYFPQTKKSNTAIYGSRSSNSFIHSKKYADVIYLDSTCNIAKTAFVNDIDVDSRRDIINAQLHYGQYGGLILKIIYCLLGLTSGLLSITGFLLWRKRKKREGQQVD